jgi:N,N'-diacetyllegionaminate synthase
VKIPHTTIIAEAGINHNGSIAIAKKLIEKAAEAGADFVKFQTFKTESLVTPLANKAEYQKKDTNKNESQFSMLKKLEIDRVTHEELIQHCDQKGIRFLSTAFDSESIELLADLKIPLYKIPSGEITNLPYLRHVSSMGKPIIISTGMATLEEVRSAIEVLLVGGTVKEKIIVLHCNTEYPTPMEHVNLEAMLTMRNEFGIAVGYSDHTLGIEIPVAAVALGAIVIEKHFTLDRTLRGPDHAGSLEPNELKSMVDAIRNTEKAMGNGIKKPSPSEIKNIPIARRSIVAKMSIIKGESFSEDNLTVKRPGTGVSPMEWDSYMKKSADRKYQKDDLIK